jgi:uncharacterized protein YndB with AHSA1/START domain
MSNDTIEREVAIEAPVDRVWSLITEAEHLGAWFGDAGADIDLRPGGAMEVRWEGHTITGVVQTVDPTSTFAFRWQQLEPSDGATLSEGNSTLVEFSLTGDEQSTLLRVVESGFASLDLPETDRTSMFESHTGGWEREIDGDLVAHASRVAV